MKQLDAKSWVKAILGIDNESPEVTHEVEEIKEEFKCDLAKYETDVKKFL